VSRMQLAPFVSSEEARRYGFDWPKTYDHDPVSHIQVTRIAEVDRGKRGWWRVLTVRTDSEQLDIYVTPTGRTRVYRKGKGELVLRTPSDN
jgi:hypothetical protein